MLACASVQASAVLQPMNVQTNFRRLAVALSAVVVFALARAHAADPKVLRINGSTTVNLPVAEAAEILRSRLNVTIRVDTQGGSPGGISMVAEGDADIGMASRPLLPSDAGKIPGAAGIQQTRIGADGVALIVSRDIWEAGVRSLSRQQMKDIYEGRITRWNQVGGPNRRIVFFNKEPGRGTWEAFAHWVYGDSSKAPPVNFPEVGGNEEARSKVASTRGALSQLSASWVDNKTVFALALRDDSGKVIEPTDANIASGEYPMNRPLLLLTRGAPTGLAKTFIDFMLSDEGQALVRKHGYLPVARPAPAATAAPR